MDPESDSIEIQITNPRPSGRVTVAVNIGLRVLAVERINIFKSSDRSKFITLLTSVHEGIDRVELERLLLHEAGRISRRAGLEQNRSKAKPEKSKDDPVASAAAKEMLHDPTLIQQIVDDIARLGVAGEKKLGATVYLIGTSRLLTKPLAGIVQGLTSSGKSYTIDAVARLFPPECIIRAHKMTPEALVHMPEGSMVHKFVVGGERSRAQNDKTADATRALREMLSDGRLTKMLPIKQGQKIETITINQPGPIAYVESTTLQNLLDEDRNRCLVLATDESPAQTRRIIEAIADQMRSATQENETQKILEKHHALQRQLCPYRVVVGFARELAKHFPFERTDARRTFGHLLRMIQAVSLLHQYQRAKDLENDAVIYATVEDYRIARYLLAEPFAQAMGPQVSRAARRFFDRMEMWFQDCEFDTNVIAQKETTIGDLQTIRQYVRALSAAGFLVETEPHRGSKPARYRINASAPVTTTVPGLPEPSQLLDTAGRAACLRDST